MHAGRVAAGAGDQPCLGNVVAIEFGQAVNRLGLQLGGGVVEAIPFAVFGRVAQAEIGAQIDNLQVPGQIAHQRLTEAMR